MGLNTILVEFGYVFIEKWIGMFMRGVIYLKKYSNLLDSASQFVLMCFVYEQ